MLGRLFGFYTHVIMLNQSKMEFVNFCSISFGELEISNLTVAFLVFLTLSTFLAVALSSAQIIKFGIDESESED